MHETLVCCHSNGSYSAVLSCHTVYNAAGSEDLNDFFCGHGVLSVKYLTLKRAKREIISFVGGGKR